MKLVLDTTLIDIVLKQWRSTEYDYTEVYNHPVFQELLAGAEEFQQKKISPEQYLYDLLHIDTIDMQQHQEEIKRNLEIIKSVDFLKISKEVECYLPVDACAQMGNVYVHPVIGIGGLAKSGFIAIDPARGREGFGKCEAILQKWLIQGEHEIDEEAWKAYYSLWGEEKLAYWLGEFICLVLIQFGYAQSVAECMIMEPLKMMKMAKAAITHIRIES